MYWRIQIIKKILIKPKFYIGGIIFNFKGIKSNILKDLESLTLKKNQLQSK